VKKPLGFVPSLGLFVRGQVLVLVAAALVALGGCASPVNMVSQWKDSSLDIPPLQKVFVIVVSKDAMRRRIWEETYLRELKARGAQAVASYTLYPDRVPTEQELKGTLPNEGYDGLLATYYRGNQEVSTYVPGTSTMQPDLVYDPWWGRYTTVYNEVYQEGYTETDLINSYEITIWTPHKPSRETPYWSSMVELTNPGTTQENSDRIVGKVMSALEDDLVVSKVK
jgi:hypothetical protein